MWLPCLERLRLPANSTTFYSSIERVFGSTHCCRIRDGSEGVDSLMRRVWSDEYRRLLREARSSDIPYSTGEVTIDSVEVRELVHDASTRPM